MLEIFQNRLTGGIPAKLGDLSQLWILNFNDNRLAGGIPTELGNLTKLRSLWLNRNGELTGPLPPM